MLNKFESLYGYLFRTYTKSIIKAVNEINEFEESDLITIGLLQYHPFDNSFYYAPTVKNIFVYPTGVKSDEFPTSKNKLWDYDLMITFANYLAKKKSSGWIEDLFQKNKKLELQKASIFSVTFSNYNKFRLAWLDWYNENINTIAKIDVKSTLSASDRVLLNQLFYFGNYLTTIIKRPAFVNKRRTSLFHSEYIFLCVNNQEILNRNNNQDYYDSEQGRLNQGCHIPWSPVPSTGEHKAELIYILEVVYKQPFNVSTKIGLIQQILHKQFNNEIFHINAVAIPVLKNGEFLGITYVAWPSFNKKNSEAIYLKIQSKIHYVLLDSRINSLLYNARFSTSKFFLRDNDKSTIAKTGAKRLFELSHIYSSSHLVTLISGEVVSFRFLVKDGIDYKIKTIECNIENCDILDWLNKLYPSRAFYQDSGVQVDWIDVSDISIPEKKKDNSEQRDTLKSNAFKQICKFTATLKKFIDNRDFSNNDYFNITNITRCTVNKGDSSEILIFFHSNYRTLYNYGRNGNLVKQSYAREFYNYLNELLDIEEVHKRIFIEEKKIREDINKGFFHYVKSILARKHRYYIDI